MSTIKVTNLRHESAAGDNITLDSSGRVGIGTASPSSLLSVHEATASTANYINVTNAATGASSLSNGLLFGVTSSGAGLCWQNENLDFLFGTNNTERVRIDSSGRLLVGTSSTSSSSAAVFQGNSASSTADAIIRLARGTTSPANGDLLGTIIFTDSGHGDAAYFYAQRDGGTWNTSTSRPSRLVFSTTANGASSPTERMRITSAGHVLVGTTSAGETSNGAHFRNFSNGTILTVVRDNDLCGIFNRLTGDGAVFHFRRSSTTVGSISVTSTATAYNTSSDYRLKENVVPLTGAADRLNQLQVCRFNFIADPDTVVDGFIAHEAQAVVPECVTGTKDEVDNEGKPIYQGIDQSKLVPLLTAALQEAIGRIETLEGMVAVNNITIDEQQHQLSTLAARLTALESA